jgi:hypothetical protein
MTRILIILLLLLFGLCRSQTTSTIFIDTLDITVEGKKIYTSNTTLLKFIPHDKKTEVTFYNDGIHKLSASFSFYRSRVPQTHFYQDFLVKDSSNSVNSHTATDYQQCLETVLENCEWRNWGYRSPPPELKTQIKLSYRIMDYAPVDTANYKYNYKQGIWIGADKDAKVVTVNFENDKKNGLATALYSNGISYNINFKDNIPDDNGHGYWGTDGGRNKFKYSYTIPTILGECDSADPNAYTSFNFYRQGKTKEIFEHHDLSVHYDKKGLRNDSIEMRVRGHFMSIKNDTMVIESDYLRIHNLHKKNADSSHYSFITTPTGFVKVPVTDISRIYYTRHEWKTFTSRITLASFVTAFVVSPLISIQKGGFNGDRFGKVTAASSCLAVLSISLNIAFSQKKFLIKPTKKSNKTWTIKPTDHD